MKSYQNRNKSQLLLAGALALASLSALAVDRTWNGGAASYTNAANWSGGVVPGAADLAINNNGTNNAVQINPGNPDWSVGGLQAGDAGSGAFNQSGQQVSILPGVRTIRLGTTPAATGVYTLSGGTLAYTNGMIAIGEIGTGILNVSGGELIGNGTLAINAGDSMATANATMDGGFEKTGHTWFAQGFYTPDPSIGLPPEGMTFVAVSNATHSFAMAPSYTANNVVMVYSNASNVSITLSAPAAYTGLSFLGSAGNTPGGAMVLSYTVHHLDNSTQTGDLVIQDWFPTNKTDLALEARGRVQANGTLVQIIADNPSMLFHDVALANTASPVTSIDLSYSAGQGVACVAALSASSGGDFLPVAFTGYNADMIVEQVTQVDAAITDELNQTGGNINVNAEMWIGNIGNGTYNLSGGTNTVGNWFAVGRSGGDGVLNMTGGELNKVGGGNFLIGTGYQSPVGGTPSGTINQSAGTINCSSGEFLIPENAPATGTLNMSGTAVLNVNNWLAVGRGGGAGMLNLTNGLINKTGGGNIVIGAGGLGEVNQYGGTISNTTSQTWLGEGFQATWNMNGGTAVLGLLRIPQGGGTASYMNLNGGELTVSEISANTGSYSEFNLNGGTLRASGPNANFIHDLVVMNLGFGGVTIDSQGYDITVPQTLTDSGGGSLTKIGSGKLDLTGPALYSGATIVNGGTLGITTTSGGGSYTFADGTRYSLKVVSLDAQAPMTDLTLNASTGITLDFDMGLFGNNSLAPVGVNGTFTANGTVTVNIPTGAFSTGTIPLISYASGAGSATFATGDLPIGVVGYVTNNTAANQVQLVIEAAAAPRWDGTVNGNWDVNTTANWVDLATASPTVFQNGNPVVLNDQAAGTTVISVVQDVQTSGMLVTNDVLSYTITGTKAIGGTASLTKQGSMPLTIGNTNTYSGATVIQGGTLTVSNLANGGLPSAIGASPAGAANLVIDNGTLSYAGPTVAIDRGFTLNNANSTIQTLGNLSLSGGVVPGNSGRFQKTGPGLFTYSGTGSNLLSGNVNPGLHVKEGPMVLNGTGAGMTNRVQNDMYVGGMPDVPASLTLSNSAVTLGAWLAVGRGNGTSGTTSSLSLYNSSISANGVSFGWWNNIAGNLAVQNVTLSGTSIITNRGGNTSNIGESGGSTTMLNILDNSEYGSANNFVIASGGEAGAGTGTVMVANSGRLWVNSYMSIANGNLRVATMTLKDNAFVRVGSDFNISDTGTSTGTLNMQDNAVASGNQVFIGKGAPTVGTLNMTGGSLSSRTTGGGIGSINVGQTGGSVGNVNQSGGTIIASGEFWVGGSGTGNWTQTGGATIATNWMAIGRNSTAVGTYSISGGSLTHILPGSRLIVGSSGSGTLTISSTAVVTAAGQVQVAENASSTGVLNLDGGSLTAPRVYGGAGNDTLNLNGGTLVAGPGAALDFISGFNAATVKAGGAVINSGGNTVNINQALLDGTGGGGLTKLGAGTLNLNGVNTYTGATLVSAGTLGGTGTIAGTVTVASGATLAPGTSIGTLTVGGAVSLAAGSTNLMEISKNASTNDVLSSAGSITYGGTLVIKNLGGVLAVNDTFKLFNASSYNGSFSAVISQVYGQTVTWDVSNLTVNGTVRVASVADAPISLNPVVSGGMLQLTWPAIGWRLEVQTNSLAVGLSNTWSTWPGSTQTNQVFIPINPNDPTVFLRLVYP